MLRAAEQPDYLDIRESTFTYLNPTGTGTFPIYDTLTKRMRGFIHYADFQKEGPYEEFFDEKRQRPKIRGYYRSGERHGDFVCFYDMPGSPVECRVHYDNGMRDGWYVRYDRFGQVRCAILYGHGVEHRRVEYRADGRIYRVVERAKGREGGAGDDRGDEGEQLRALHGPGAAREAREGVRVPLPRCGHPVC